MKLVTPLGFSKVNDGIYRSAYPADKTLPFVKTLNLKSMVCLCPNDIKPELVVFAKENNIKIMEHDLRLNQEPFLLMSEIEMQTVVSNLLVPENLPSLIFCTNGKVRSGCVVACLRKKQNWGMASIVSEFEQLSEAEGTFSDLQFIDSFKPLK